MGEVILVLPDDRARNRTTPHGTRSGGVLLALLSGYKHPPLARPLIQPARSPPRSHGRLHTSDRAVWTSDCLPICKMRLRSEAARGTPTNRSCRLCDPGSGRCRGLCVRPKRSQVRTGDPAAPPLDCKLPTGTHTADNLNVVLKDRRMDPTNTQFHAPGPG